ncbi:MAG: pilus assembly protein PilM [Candidatus Peribacter sp.]|jgi:hypothetical protein|nr:pilus assembly protein PilM [Candidatus Peribacter sp.]MBT4392673.1 pilus assembly protein PilM [Candidatus Peribacter sp.]MBT4600710.1 pilus assembly protein PilM [Candidatus Peribacter sp.]MBT5148621.1 pilus assembly protein PilM [Candidatus Peribacter sp.]MBT5637783.1 pilus assembly protein PilM [Candidatus Peribacter sp.]
MLGLQCTESTIRIAAAKKSGQLLSVQARAEQKILKDVISEGIVIDSEQTIDALKKLKSSIKRSGKATLCLSPSTVHTRLLRIPRLRSGRLTSALRKEIESVLPGEMNDMHILITPVRRDNRGTRIAVTAVRKDVISSYRNLLKASKLSMGRVTTTALALGDMLKHTNAFVLVNIEDAEPSVVVFYGGQPVDEHVLSSAAPQTILSTVRALIAEYREDDMHIQHVAVHGSKEAFAKIEQGFIPKKNAEEKREEMEGAVTVEHVLPGLKKDDLVWGGLIASSLGKGLDIRKSASSLSFKQCVLFGFSTVVASYFLWRIVQIQLVSFS